jgi:hypothetical protein
MCIIRYSDQYIHVTKQIVNILNTLLFKIKFVSGVQATKFLVGNIA